ncbi:PIN domain-containing protein [Sphingobacterium sp. SGL-16]|uniref:PIN domain-containing protein n=1 Tax=Sphingobacterium sp. SGL-16 TaxID=2710883 RepID=UPI0013ED6670|nr:PIN domain-containing protein [Sphingobacterium sp. SGL-16]NGM72758.1 DUF4935 domain-containing protein [Sphingobacterium sp. SGL-16]
MFLVLIDTSAYEDVRLSFKGAVFESLKGLSDDEKITILGCSVIDKEIDSHLLESVVASVNRLKKTSGDFDRVTRDDLGEISRLLVDDKLLKKNVYEERKGRKQEFFDSVTFELIDLAYADVETIFDNYFALMPPFGEGKKKHEFPDAFILSAFVKSYEDKLASTCVVSQDSDWHNYLEKYPEIRRFHKISEFSDFVNKNYDSEVTKRLGYVLDRRIDVISRYIKDNVEDYLFEVDDCWLDSEVELTPSSLTVNVHNYNVLFISPTGAEIEVTAQFKFDLDVWADDEESAFKDSDTKDWIYIGRNQYNISVDKEISVMISVSFDSHPDDMLQSFTVETVKIPKDLYYISGEEHNFILVRHWTED